MDWVMSSMNVVGSPSPVGLLDVALPQETKSHLKSPKFQSIFNLDQSFLLSTTRNHSDSHLEPPCVIFGSYGFKF